MRQQTLTLYICEFCSKEYKLREGAEACEDKHKAQGLVSIKDPFPIEDLRE